MRREVKFDYDLESMPLEVKTDSVPGSNEEVAVFFYDNQGQDAGGVAVMFSSSLQYKLVWCISSWTDFKAPLPTAQQKVWRLTVSESGDQRVILHCNEEEVLNEPISASTCNSNQFSRIWGKDIERLKFYKNDDASDSYRPYGGN